jgi:hypothetical protein
MPELDLTAIEDAVPPQSGPPQAVVVIPDPAEIQRAVDLLCVPGGVYEIRALGSSGKA